MRKLLPHRITCCAQPWVSAVRNLRGRRARVVYSEAMAVKLAMPDKLVENLKAVLLPELRRLHDEIQGHRKESANEFRMIRAEMKALDERLTGRMDALEDKLNSRMELLEMRLGGRMDSIEVRMASLEDRFSVRMIALEEKVTTTTQIRERLAVLEDRLPRQ
jgi:chromosome segregation ATPase